VVAWGRTAEVICQYKRKGHSISAEGRWQERSWDGEDGKTYTVIELNAFRVDFGSRERNVAGEKAVA
jgi:single-strand DNA-binding protein